MTRPTATSWSRRRLRRAAEAVLAAGLRAADPVPLVERNLARRGRSLAVGGERVSLARGRLVLVAVGKAARPMALAAEARLGDLLDEALVVEAGAEPRPSPLPRAEANGGPQQRLRTRFLQAGHPVPDERGRAAAREVLALAESLGRGDVLLVLLSGGASALLPAPASGVSLADKAATTAALLRAGATIHELNTVRKHLSALKGGGLAKAAAPARVFCLALSDVVGDDPATIGSGLTAPDPTTYDEALAVLSRRGPHAIPDAVRKRLEAGARGEVAETPKPGDPIFRRATTLVIGGNAASLAAAGREARRWGLRPVVLTTRLQGEAREVGSLLTAVLRECVETGRPAAPPLCLLAGGETTVTVRGQGRGGRNQELATAAALSLAGFPVAAVVGSLATDGIDGASDAAGGLVDDTTLIRSQRAGLAPPDVFLARSDSRNFLAPLGDLLVTGPSGTNVADLTVLLAGASLRGPRHGR